MFDDSSVFIITSDENIYRLEVEREVQAAICASFSTAVNLMTKGKTVCEFTVNYKPEDDEIIRIGNFQLPNLIIDAIRNPIGIDSYRKDTNVSEDGGKGCFGFPEIKAIFVGERVKDDKGEYFNIGFQKYRKEQNLIAIPFRLFFSNDTFKLEKHFGIGITNNVDCYYTKGELQFTSFYYARQVFDLRDYYRTASDSEVEEFTKNEAIEFENADMIGSMANVYVRRKIAKINDSDILKNYNAKEIKNIAKKAGIDIKTHNKKIVIPADKESALAVLAFLDEEAYRGPFSNDLLLANSKRVLRKG